jgi:hypothetical protein
MSHPRLKPAIAFFRRDAHGPLKDVEQAERTLIEAYAERTGYEIVFEFVHLGSSADELFDSPAFAKMLARLEAKKALTVIVATATTLADNPLVHAVASARFRKYGIELLVAAPLAPTAITTSPTQIVDHVFQISERFEEHLSRMADRRRVKFGPARRKNYVEMFPEAVSLAKALHQRSLRDGVRRSLRELSAMLARQGHLNNAGNPYHPDEVRRMIKGPDPLRMAGPGA